jgi:nucleoside-triphosphatase
VLLLTGYPGIGKTTVLSKTVNLLKEKGYCVGGMISREVREDRTRIGFEIVDLKSDRRGWLANVMQRDGPRVGKYRVKKEDLDKIGAEAIEEAVKNCDVIAIDEIGPMELFSEKFKDAVLKALESHKLVLAIVHWRMQDKLTNGAKKREDAETIFVTQENREKLPAQILEKALDIVKQI